MRKSKIQNFFPLTNELSQKKKKKKKKNEPIDENLYLNRLCTLSDILF